MAKSKSLALPKGWHPAGSHPKSYEMGLCADTCHSGTRCARIQSIEKSVAGFGTLMQMVDAGSFLNKRMKLGAQIKTENVDWAALWMRIDGENGKALGFDNMQKNPIKDTTDWHYYECVLDVPEASKFIAFGVLLSARGKVWFTNVALEAVSNDTETTDNREILSNGALPINLKFEEV